MKEKYSILILLVCLCFSGWKFVLAPAGCLSKAVCQNQLVLSKQKEDWNQIEGTYCRVSYHQKTQEAQTTLHIADSYFPWVAQDFSWKREGKINIFLCETEEEMRQALHLTDETPVPMGAYYQGAALVLSPSLWVQSKESWKQTEEYLESGPVVHEMVHFAMDEKAQGQYPHWLSEGVALYYEKKYTGFEWRNDLKEAGKQLTMEELSHHFETLDPAVSYRKSYDWVYGFVRTYGEEELQNLLNSGQMSQMN